MKIEFLWEYSRRLAFLALMSGRLNAQMAWQTVDTVDRVQYSDLVTGAPGEAYAVGEYYPASGASIALFRRSVDEGQTWQTVASPPTPAGSAWSDFTRVSANRSGRVYALRQVPTGQTSRFELWQAAAGTGGSNLALVTTFKAGYFTIAGISVDAAGNAYACGEWNDPVQPRWHALKGTPSGNTLSWSILDDFVPENTNAWPRPKVIAVRPATDVHEPVEIWVGGVVDTGASSVVQITFRRSPDGGLTWLPAGGFEDNNVGLGLQDLAIARDGTAYTVGRTRRGVGYAWLTRRSANGGASWEVVDDVGNNFGGLSVDADDSGRVIATGPGWNSPSLTLVRMSSTGAAGTWQDTDSFGTSAVGALESAVAIDPLGNAYVCGGATDPVVLGKGWIRKLPAPVRPMLTFDHFGSLFTVSWPTNATGSLLQSATTLRNGGDWVDRLDLIPAPLGDRKVVTLDATNRAEFFRLRRP